MNTNAFSNATVVFLCAIVGVPIVAALSEKLVSVSGRRKEVGRVTKSVVTLVSWLIVALYILADLGFEFLTLIQAIFVVTGAIIVVIVVYGFGKDALIGLMLVSDDDFQPGVKVEIKDSFHLIGYIRTIGITRTKVAGDDGRIYVLPNRMFQTAVFSIMSTPSTS